MPASQDAREKAPKPIGRARVDAKGVEKNLSDRVLALATGKTQQEITAACKGAIRTLFAWVISAGEMRLGPACIARDANVVAS